MIWLIQKLAVKIGVTSQAVSKWERGQSLPDIITFSQLCNILDVSADVLLEMNSNIISENTDVHINTEILKELRQCQASLELIFGKDLIEAFQKQPIMPYITEIRLDLARQGLLMPIVHIKDNLEINPREFMVLSYHRVLYSQEVENIDENTTKNIAQQLSETVQKNYGYILNNDIVRKIVENLKVDYPALVEGIIPEHISYSLLKNVMVKLLERGDGLNYLVKTIEVLDSVITCKPSSSLNELAAAVCKEIEREDNYWVYMAKRRGERY